MDLLLGHSKLIPCFPSGLASECNAGGRLLPLCHYTIINDIHNFELIIGVGAFSVISVLNLQVSEDESFHSPIIHVFCHII